MTYASALAISADHPADELDALVEVAIVRFLNGETEGSELFHALYDEPLDEPIPASMLALVRSTEPVAV
jgi:hypothetical protein